MTTLDDAVRVFAARLLVDDDEPGLPMTPFARLTHDVTKRGRQSREAAGAERATKRFARKPRWEVPPDADAAPPGAIVVVPFTATIALGKAKARQGSAVAEAKRRSAPRALRGHRLSVRYEALAFGRDAQGRWLLHAELGKGKDWTTARCCPHGIPAGLTIGGGHFRSIFHSELPDGRVLHRVLAQNPTRAPVQFSLHSHKSTDPRRFAAEGWLGKHTLEIPAGGELVIPVAVGATDTYRTLAVAGNDPGNRDRPSTFFAPLPLMRVAGHPSGSVEGCPGDAPFSFSFWDREQALHALGLPHGEHLLLELTVTGLAISRGMLSQVLEANVADAAAASGTWALVRQSVSTERGLDIGIEAQDLAALWSALEAPLNKHSILSGWAHFNGAQGRVSLGVGARRGEQVGWR